MALDVVLAGSPAAAALRAHDAAALALASKPDPGGARLAALARASSDVEALGGWEARERAREALAELGIGADAAERPVAALSGGQVQAPCPLPDRGCICGEDQQVRRPLMHHRKDSLGLCTQCSNSRQAVPGASSVGFTAVTRSP